MLFKRPILLCKTKTNAGGWWHVDQNSLRGPTRVGRVCVQGLVSFTKADESTGGLCVIPGSHLLHNAVCDRAPSAKMKNDFVQIDPLDPVLTMPKKLVCCEPGDLLVWDSRTIHCNTPALKPAVDPSLEQQMSHHQVSLADDRETYRYSNLRGESVFALQAVLRVCGQSTAGSRAQLEDRVESFYKSHPPPPSNAASAHDSADAASANAHVAPPLLRLVSYVCMLPRSFASDSVLADRKRGFLHRIPTSHWPTMPIRISHEHAEPRQPAGSNDEVLRLVGYSDAEISALRSAELERSPASGAM